MNNCRSEVKSHILQTKFYKNWPTLNAYKEIKFLNFIKLNMFTNSIENSDQNLFDAFAGMFGEDHQPYTSMFSLDDNTDVIRNESYENCDNVNSPSRDALIGDCTPDFGGFVFSQENVATKDESLPILLPADTPPHHSIESEDFFYQFELLYLPISSKPFWVSFSSSCSE